MDLLEEVPDIIEEIEERALQKENQEKIKIIEKTKEVEPEDKYI